MEGGEDEEEAGAEDEDVPCVTCCGHLRASGGLTQQRRTGQVYAGYGLITPAFGVTKIEDKLKVFIHTAADPFTP